jgi:hypothetical protein
MSFVTKLVRKWGTTGKEYKNKSHIMEALQKERKDLITLVSKDELQKMSRNVYAMGGTKRSFSPVLIKYYKFVPPFYAYQ